MRRRSRLPRFDRWLLAVAAILFTLAMVAAVAAVAFSIAEVLAGR
jgi:hypothetical protein